MTRDAALCPTQMDQDPTGGLVGGAIQPRPHQVEALTSLTTALAVHDRAQLVMACGTGKTLVGRWYAETSESTRVLVLLPSLGLVAQTLREWRRSNRGSQWRFRALVVCSDPTTAAGAAERLEDETPDQGEWDDVDAEVTTSPSRAANFMTQAPPATGAQVVFSTYHSSPVVAAAQRMVNASMESETVFDLVLADEAHRLAGQPSEAFTTVLDARQIVARRRLFMTATPRVYGGEQGFSMDDPHVFGPLAHTVTFSDAITAGLLTDYQVVVIGRHHADPGSTANPIDLVAASVLQAIDQHGLRRILTFHGRVSKAQAFAAGLDGRVTSQGTSVAARHVFGAMPAIKKLEVLEWLAGDRPQLAPGAVDGGSAETEEARIVSNARCLSEGIDVPAVDGVVFADQRSSVIDIIQAIGRVLRPSPGKSVGTIVLPVTVEPGADMDTELSLSAFAPVWTVLRALRAHDHQFDAELIAMHRAQLRRRGDDTPVSKPPRLRFDLPPDIALPEIELRLADETGSTWDRNLLLLEQWMEENPHRLMPRLMKVAYGDKEIGLGEWAEQQRIARRRGVLRQERADRLAQIPGWVWDKSAARWEATVDKLRAYASEHGTIAENPTGESRFTKMKDAETPSRDLGVWMATQRQAYRLGTLSTDQIETLEELPGWRWDAGLSTTDIDMVEALREFVEFEKHADVPEDHCEGGLRLGAWCWAIRRRRWTGTLAPALFDEIRAATPSKFRAGHFEWAKSETQWRIGYFAVRQFADREGAATPTASVVEELPDTTVHAGQWAALQRMHYRRGLLDPRHAELLEALPGWQWERQLTRVEAQPPVELPPGLTHGSPGAYGPDHRCRCGDCLEWRRSSDVARLAKARDRIVDPVPAEEARSHLEELEAAGVKRGTLVTVSGVPLGAIRKVAKGTLRMERDHRDRLLATTLEACRADESLAGSRGRTRSAGSEKVDSAPTWVFLDDLEQRGFGITWVSRELGYAGALQVKRGRRVSRRIHEAIRDLYMRVGDRQMPELPKNARRPSLAELEAATAQAAVA